MPDGGPRGSIASASDHNKTAPNIDVEDCDGDGRVQPLVEQEEEVEESEAKKLAGSMVDTLGENVMNDFEELQ